MRLNRLRFESERGPMLEQNASEVVSEGEDMLLVSAISAQWREFMNVQIVLKGQILSIVGCVKLIRHRSVKWIRITR